LQFRLLHTSSLEQLLPFRRNVANIKSIIQIPTNVRLVLEIGGSTNNHFLRLLLLALEARKQSLLLLLVFLFDGVGSLGSRGRSRRRSVTARRRQGWSWCRSRNRSRCSSDRRGSVGIGRNRLRWRVVDRSRGVDSRGSGISSGSIVPSSSRSSNIWSAGSSVDFFSSNDNIVVELLGISIVSKGESSNAVVHFPGVEKILLQGVEKSFVHLLFKDGFLLLFVVLG
jgi:hypothetical protein